MLGVVRNGIDVERFPLTTEKTGYLLWLGRICEEKGTHVAIELAQRAKLPIVIAGQVYPFSYHQRYFERQVQPHLGDAGVAFIERPDFREKVQLLRHARALLVTSLIDETSSLVALEAMACGTLVVGFRRGAIPSVVAHGETGLIPGFSRRDGGGSAVDQCLRRGLPQTCGGVLLQPAHGRRLRVFVRARAGPTRVAPGCRLRRLTAVRNDLPRINTDQTNVWKEGQLRNKPGAAREKVSSEDWLRKSRVAAADGSPRREPWVRIAIRAISPGGA